MRLHLRSRREILWQFASLRKRLLNACDLSPVRAGAAVWARTALAAKSALS
ncbi:hypothetical protein [Methylocella tundrae]|jgi:hypothetical protein|uniref:hypothetical protein n=1 Tax=Methylocella tundrae TaxID=227605 RepID=UPI00141B31BE|nr:hypothetical protein [Methylocella tundrae]WPP03499.1 hypothetical protein SIN04_13600 [Methylocella tundrae]